MPSGGQFAASSHAESAWAQMFPDPKFPPGTRLATQDGQYGEVFGDTTRDVLTVAMDGGGVMYASHSKVSTVEDYLETSMPAVEGPNLPPVPEDTPASAVHAFLLEHRPAADLATNPAARGRERVAKQLRSALASNEADTARITAGTLPESPAAQPLTGKRSRQLAQHFMEQARGFGDELRRHQLDTTPTFYLPGQYRPVHALELELTAARDTAAEAAVRFTAGVGNLTPDQKDVYTERTVVLLDDFIVKTPELANVAWNDAEWVPPAATA
jgi:hypothetical protein